MALKLSLTTVKSSSVNKSWSDSLDELPTIRKVHSSWTDPLSQRIFTWIDTTCEAVKSYRSRAIDIDGLAKEAVDSLRSTILVSEIIPKPLKDPKLDRIWVWEGSDVTLYREKVGFFSPYDANEMEITEHLFAKIMLQWVQTTPIEPLEVVADTENDIEQKLCMWRQMMQDLNMRKAIEAIRLGQRWVPEKDKEIVGYPMAVEVSGAFTSLSETQSKALAVFKPILASRQFTANSEEAEALSALEAMFKEAPVSLNDDSARLDFSHLLTSLLCNIIKPKVENAKGIGKQIKQLLSVVIPKGESLEVFIDTYRKGSEETVIIKSSGAVKEPETPNPAQIGVLTILESMNISGQFTTSEEEKALLNDLKAMLLAASTSLTNEIALKNFSNLLCHLLCNVVQPKGESAKAFEDQIKALLSATLPQGYSPELLMKVFGTVAKEMAVKPIVATIQGEIKKTASETEVKVKENLGTDKKELLATNSIRRDNFEKTLPKVQSAQVRVPGVAMNLLNLVTKASKLGDKKPR